MRIARPFAVAAMLAAGVTVAPAYTFAGQSTGLQVRFIESAPKDRFEIVNYGTCDAGRFELVLDLSDAAGGLIFDTTGSGAGVEVFQPFEIVRGAISLAPAGVTDGDRSMAILINGLAPGESAAFTIDVDDTKGSTLGQTRVAGSEIAGGTAVIVAGPGAGQRGEFTADSVATIPMDACIS